ncbi:MAG: ABC transporter ATP-binding protein [Candidatus Aureabacteria bacterium]|nr:ABC transporter ATP-binding protein [Candidatus Auribacterota bacterium]
MKKYLKVLRVAFPYAHVWTAALVFMGIFTLCNAVSVMGMIPLIDRVLAGKPVTFHLSVDVPYKEKLDWLLAWVNQYQPLVLLKMICFFLVTATVIKGISQFFQEVLMEWVSQKIARDLRCALFNKFFYLPMSFFSGSRTGELITRITSDVGLLQVIFSGRFTNSILDCLHFFPFMIIVILMDWKMALICLVVIPLAMTPIVLIGRKIRKFSRKTQENLADVSSRVHEVVGALKIVKVFGQTEKEQSRFGDVCGKAVKIRVKSQKKEAILTPVTELIGVGTGGLLLWWFAPLVLHGKMSLGTFLTYFTCIGCMIKPIKTFGKIQATIQIAMGGADRIFHLLEQPDETGELTGEKMDLKFTEQIRFEQVSYSYQKDIPVLRNINFEMKKGEVIALVGPSGSGKTTIANMIPRFFDPLSGSIWIDGKNMKNIHVSSIRKIMGLVTQEPILFNATVRENICYAKPDAAMEEIVKAAKLARAHEFISSMEKGYDTVIGERGVRLSGGEKQRISIARALLKNPDVFIFDEATSALDTENEKYVQEAIDQVMEDRTVLVIAHRLSTVVKAHQILVLENGRIIQRGTHSELINTEGLYKKLYEMNFET